MKSLLLSMMLASIVSGSEIIESPAHPWGRLDKTHIYLPAPDAVIELLDKPSENTEWHFVHTSDDLIVSFLGNAGLDPLVYPEFQRARWLSLEDHVVITPSPAALLGMTPNARLHLYRVLARWEKNHAHRTPVYFPKGALSEWFAGSGLSVRYRSLIERLIYVENGLSFFADVPLLMSLTESATEERAVIKLLSRQHTVLAQLKLSHSDQLSPAVDYWSVGRRGKELRPLLKSIVDDRQIDRIDLAHLLPPLPRKLMNQFPTLYEGRRGRFPDAFWTAFNFFDSETLEIYADSPNLVDHLHADYQIVKDPNDDQFGDLLLFNHGAEHTYTHACVYLADQLVYTKNSPKPTTPWVILPKAEVTALQALDGTLPHVERWRLRVK